MSYSRAAILDSLSRLPAGASVAIFALGSELRLVQGFTSDLDLIRKKLGSAPTLSPVPDLSFGPMGFWPRIRVETTVDAFKELALYLTGVPGRKNLIWISAAIPLQIGVPQSAKGIRDFSDNMKRIDAMFSRARVSVYPIDPRGLMTLPAPARHTESAVMPAEMQAVISEAFADDVDTPMGWWDEHVIMMRMADATGGHAYFNTNAVGEAVNAAMADASDYYTIAYVPPKNGRGDAYRTIEVRLTHGDYALAYRHGYFPSSSREARNATGKRLSPITSALIHGVPPLTEITFTVHADSKAAADRDPAGYAASLKKHEARFLLDYTIDPHTIELQPARQDAGKAEIEIAQAAYALDGRRVATSDSGLEITLKPLRANEAIRVPQEISIPASACFLRVAVRDASSGKIGSLEFALPGSAKSH